MGTDIRVGIARADVVGSLLRPEYLRQARQAVREGRMSEDELRAVEDRAVLEAITLQEAAGLDVITDGEFRRQSWVVTIPLREDPVHRAPLIGFEYRPADPGWWALWKEPDGRPAQVWATIEKQPFVTQRIQVGRDVVSDEYGFLKAHARARTKYTIPAPSWHRIFWHREYSRHAYPTPEEFLWDIARYLREHVVRRLLELGCDYIQLDAPNYAQWHVDPGNRAAFAAAGHDMDAELVADAEIDNTVFEGITGITRAIHICRGNGAGGRWLASGGYDRIADVVFPRLTNYDRLLLEYDSERAGDFTPLRHVLPQHQVVLGLITTKRGELEDPTQVEARIHEAARFVPLQRLALSPQCGFASGEMATTTTPAQQEAKLRLVAEVARRVWPR